MDPSSSNHNGDGGRSKSTMENLYPDLNSYATPTTSSSSSLEVPSTSASAQKTVNDKNNSSSSAWQTVPINSEHDPSPPSASSSSSASAAQRTASTGSIQESLEINNATKDTDSILSSLNRKNKNLAPIFTRDYYGESGGVGGITTSVGKGWKGLSSLEKSLSVSLGVVSTLSLALMIAVIVVGVQLNDENNCKLVSVTQPSTACPTLPSTTPKDDRCDSTARPRPLRRGVTTTPTPPVTEPVTGEDEGTTEAENSQIIRSSPAIGSSKSSSCLVSEKYNNATICLTPECFRMAGQIMESIDFDANPCQNFYQFSCGNWIKSSSGDKSENVRRKLLLEIKGLLETTESSRNSSAEQPKTRGFSLAQQFYHSCMHPLLDDEVAVAEVRVLLDTMTSVQPGITTRMQRVAIILANIRRFLNGNYIVGVEVAADDKQSKENAIYLTHPQFGLSFLLQELNIDLDQSDEKIPALYKNLVQKLWSLVYPEESDAANLERIWRDFEDFEQKLKRISEQDDTQEDPQEQNYNLLSQMNSTDISPTMVSWLTGLTNLILTSPTTTNITDQTNKKNERLPKVILKNVKYFKELENVLEGSDAVTIGNYLQLRILLSYAPHSGEIFSELFAGFKRKVEGTEAIYKPKWQTCTEETNNLFGWAISHRLIQLSVNSMMTMQDKLNETAYYLKDSLQESICSAPWISQNETRLAGKRKLESLETFLGFPKEWMEEGSQTPSNTSTNVETLNLGNSFVESFYSDMNFTDALNYLQNYVETRVWLSRKQLEEIREPSLGSQNCGDFWPKFHYPSSSKAFYSEKLNYLALPFGVVDTSSSSLLSLVGDSTLEFPALQYGYVGVLMAQLMLQGFDEQGSYRNESGNIDPWWDTETRENYRNLSTCFLDQFENNMNSAFADDYYIKNDEASSPESLDDLESFGVQDDPTDGDSKSQNDTQKNMMIDATISSQRNKNNNKLIRKLILQNGALALAYRAYHSQSFEQEFDEMLLPGLENFTPEQLFFLTFVQGQCSSLASQRSAGEMVVENMLQNSVEFATHWKCPLPDEESTCRIF